MPLLLTANLNVLLNRLRLVYLSPQINIWLFFSYKQPIQSKKKYSYKVAVDGGVVLVLARHGLRFSWVQLVCELIRRVINYFSSTAKCFCNLIYICRDATA